MWGFVSSPSLFSFQTVEKVRDANRGYFIINCGVEQAATILKQDAIVRKSRFAGCASGPFPASPVERTAKAFDRGGDQILPLFAQFANGGS